MSGREATRLRRDNRAIAKRFAQDKFLEDWLANSRRDRLDVTLWEKNADDDEKQGLAQGAGFRGWSNFRAWCVDTNRALELFAMDPSFKKFWSTLRESDRGGGWFQPFYGPHNGGVPCGILRSIEQWHQEPKFTVAELRVHRKKIADAAEKLLFLLESVTPGGVNDDFRTFRLDEARAVSLLTVFATPDAIHDGWGRFAKRHHVVGRLRFAGVHPLAAVADIHASATRQQRERGNFPRKVRTTSAFRTFLILELSTRLSVFHSRNAMPVTDEVIADLVGRLANTDCSRDDVRKALTSWRLEDSWPAAGEMVHRKALAR